MVNYGIPYDRIVAYTYDADYHCVECAGNEHADDDAADDTTDANGIPYDAEDSEGNNVHPVFAGQMDGDTVERCTDCGTIVCMCCGDRDAKRRRYSKCTNCRTAWQVST
jgi:hypothetical protein